MNISKADAVAHLAKWFDAGTKVRLTYNTMTGNCIMVGKIKDLNATAIKVSGADSEVMLYFRNTSDYHYNDARQPDSETTRDRENKYPTVIKVKFSGGDFLEIHEFFDDQEKPRA